MMNKKQLIGIGIFVVLIPDIVIVFCLASAKFITTVILSSLILLTPAGLDIVTFKVF